MESRFLKILLIGFILTHSACSSFSPSRKIASNYHLNSKCGEFGEIVIEDDILKINPGTSDEIIFTLKKHDVPVERPYGVYSARTSGGEAGDILFLIYGNVLFPPAPNTTRYAAKYSISHDNGDNPDPQYVTCIQK